MNRKIPDSLRFCASSLLEEEVKAWKDWYSILSLPDKRNTGRVLRRAHEWITDPATSPGSNREDYFVMNVIGSTARRRPDYGDVDLLLVTNRIWQALSNESNIPALMQRIRYGQNPIDVSETYLVEIDRNPDESYQQVPRPERTTLTIKPVEGKGKRIHLTIQPEVPSEDAWREVDKEARVVLYRHGNVYGHYTGQLDLQGIARILRAPGIPIHDVSTPMGD